MCRARTGAGPESAASKCGAASRFAARGAASRLGEGARACPPQQHPAPPPLLHGADRLPGRIGGSTGDTSAGASSLATGGGAVGCSWPVCAAAVVAASSKAAKARSSQERLLTRHTLQQSSFRYYGSRRRRGSPRKAVQREREGRGGHEGRQYDGNAKAAESAKKLFELPSSERQRQDWPYPATVKSRVPQMYPVPALGDVFAFLFRGRPAALPTTAPQFILRGLGVEAVFSFAVLRPSR